jgi:phytoene dehydrogenase-like protein
MVDREFDGVIVGAGHHGLILGSYLARCGLRIAVLERRLQYGGGLETLQPGLPGFYHNYHSINHFNITAAPWYRDLELGSSAPYITPRYEFGQPHADGSALILSRDIDETVASIARFSPRDAETFRAWNEMAEAITSDIFLAERYSEPLAEDERNALLATSAAGREFQRIIGHQPLDLVRSLFESEVVQLLMLFKISLFGTVLYDALTQSSPMGSLVRAFDLTSGYQVCQGGSYNLARGLMESFIRHGGTYLNRAEVDRIVVEHGRAVGVELADGRTVRAGRFVASTVDVHQTFTRMVEARELPPEHRDKVAAFKLTPWTLFGLHLSLREAPRHTAAAYDPHIDEALKFNIGCESLDQLFALHDEVAAGQVPSTVSFGSGAISVLDPTQAPPDGATAYAWHVMPYAPDGDPAKVDVIQEEFADRIIDTWGRYAPNVNPSNILERHIYTARQYAGDLINMRQGDIFMGSFAGDQTMWNHFGYRTPIEGLYMAGSATHPGGAISGGAGYIVAGIIAAELGLETWWAPVDARAALAGLADREARR